MKWAIEEYGEFIILFLFCCAIITFYIGMIGMMSVSMGTAYNSTDHTSFMVNLAKAFF